MANIKISQLPSTFTLDGTELHVVVQGGVTKKILNSTLKADILADVVTPTVVTIYNSSGELFDTGVATTRDFLFKTSDNGTYNPSGTYHEMRFNAAYNDSGGYSTSPGWFGMKGAGVNNKLVAFNMYGGGIPILEMFAVDTVVARTRTLQLSSDSLYLGTETASGAINLQFSDSGAVISDFRSTPLGITYNGNYSSTIITNDRAVPDVGTVKSLITANAASIYTASGNVFDTGLATVRRFDFQTDNNGTYNPDGKIAIMSYGGYYNVGNGVMTVNPGSIGFKTTWAADGKKAALNIRANSPLIQILASAGFGTNIRELVAHDAGLVLSTGNSVGAEIIQLSFNDSGAVVGDFRTGGAALGMLYFADYSANIITNDRSITDTGSVKKLRQQANTWATAGRPVPVAGIFGFNTDTAKFEGYTGTTWVDFH